MIVFRKGHLLIALAFCFACAILPFRSYAHRIMVDYVVDGKSVSVDVFFPDGKPAKNVKIEVYRADETLYLSGETNAEGQFSFDLADEVHLKLVATGKLGHRAEQEVYLGEVTSEESERLERAAPTEEKVKRREPIPLRKIFAGFGYIFGVTGILMYLKARRDLRKANVSSGDR